MNYNNDRYMSVRTLSTKLERLTMALYRKDNNEKQGLKFCKHKHKFSFV